MTWDAPRGPLSDLLWLAELVLWTVVVLTGRVR